MVRLGGEGLMAELYGLNFFFFIGELARVRRRREERRKKEEERGGEVAEWEWRKKKGIRTPRGIFSLSHTSPETTPQKSFSFTLVPHFVALKSFPYKFSQTRP